MTDELLAELGIYPVGDPSLRMYIINNSYKIKISPTDTLADIFVKVYKETLVFGTKNIDVK